MLYELNKHGNKAVVDTFGGELISFQTSDKTEYLWGGDPSYWNGRSPHLFPIIGTTKHSSSLKKHGFVRIQDLSLISYTDSEISLCLNDTEATRECYPYSFSFIVTHKLHKEGFTTSYTIRNTDSKAMPFCIGGHVGFACPLHEDELFEDYLVHFPNQEVLHPLTMTSNNLYDDNLRYTLECNQGFLPLSYNLFDSDALIFNPANVSEVSLIHKKTRKGVHFSFPDFPVLALWTMPHKESPYICIEPWHGMPALVSDGDTLFDKPYVTVLEPSTEKTFTYEMSII